MHLNHGAKERPVNVRHSFGLVRPVKNIFQNLYCHLCRSLLLTMIQQGRSTSKLISSVYTGMIKALSSYGYRFRRLLFFSFAVSTRFHTKQAASPPLRTLSFWPSLNFPGVSSPKRHHSPDVPFVTATEKTSATNLLTIQSSLALRP